MKMKPKLSVLIITKNAAETLRESLESVKDLANEIVALDDYSKDSTVEILKNYGAKVFLHRESDLGKQRKYGLSKVRGEWVLVLDSDEVVSRELYNEIKELKSTKFHPPAGGPNPKKIPNSKSQNIRKVTGYYILFQNHFLGRPLNYGGEDYKKLILFKKDAVIIAPALVHEKFEIKNGKQGVLKNKILHYSYRTLYQMFIKFTDYAIREARQKYRSGEKTSFGKIFFYPPHMFWARFIKDKGHRDGIFRIPLDVGFAYMEFLTYVLLIFYSWRSSKLKTQTCLPAGKVSKPNFKVKS